MKKLLPALAIVMILFSCNKGADKGKFTVNGELRSTKSQKVFLEELFFSQKPPEVLDTGITKDGKFTVSAIADEEGLYRIVAENGTDAFFFVNDGSNINFTADENKPGRANQSFTGAANSSLKKLMLYSDSVENLIGAKDRVLTELKKSGTADTDSVYMALKKDLTTLNEMLTKYCFDFLDTTKSPVVALFAAYLAPVEMSKIETPLTGLIKRFPDHKGVAGAISYVKAQMAQKDQPQTKDQSPATIGSAAPDITMNDVNDKPFSLSQLRGKYVLVDFWASWCGPCREENPNVVAAYNQFKNKNFTVLGVSLDENKDAWLKAITADNLPWQHISDLKKWTSAVVSLYGIEGIPYNVLVDPQGKIIASGLRGQDLQNKLSEILK